MTEPEPKTPDTGTGPQLGRAASRGVSLLMVATLLAKGASMLAQIALGYLLAKDDFAVYGIALGLAGFARAFQSGAVDYYLMGRSRDEFDQDGSACFWMATTFNVLIAILIAIVAIPAGTVYDDERVMWILWIIAASIFICSPATTLNARLHVELKHKVVARKAVYMAIIRHGLVVLLAFLGTGALCFVLPLLVIPLFDAWYSYRHVRITPWKGKVHREQWSIIFRRTRWLMLAAFAACFSNQGDYIVAGLLIAKPIVGVYYFAFQLVAQAGVLITQNLRLVLIPVLTRMNDNNDRQSVALMRSFRAALMALPFVTMGIGTVIAPLEFLIWGGKWAEAVIPIQIFAVATPFQTVMGINEAALLATSRFPMYFAAQLVRGVVIVVATWLGCIYGGTAVSLAIAVGGSSVVLAPFLTGYILRRYNFSRMRFALVFVQGPAVAIGSALASQAVVWMLLSDQVQFRVEGDPEPTRLGSALEFLFVGFTYVVIYVVAARLLLRDGMLDLLKALPRRLSNPASRVLRLPIPETSPGTAGPEGASPAPAADEASELRD